VLPNRKPWDHAIELEVDAKESSTKVYPLSPNEQAELDTFIEENLMLGRIRSSKSPMVAPIFFIKKKDGSLQLVQDYRPTLDSKKEVQSFLGFTNFYCHFIERFSHLAHPLFNLTWNDSKWCWSESEISAFEAI
jgi:hypothetical protein